MRPDTGQSRWRHVIKAGAGSKGGSGFWVIKKVMEGRIKITESVTDPGKPITKKQWIPKNGEMYKHISGNLEDSAFISLLNQSSGNESHSKQLFYIRQGYVIFFRYLKFCLDQASFSLISVCMNAIFLFEIAVNTSNISMCKHPTPGQTFLLIFCQYLAGILLFPCLSHQPSSMKTCY